MFIYTRFRIFFLLIIISACNRPAETIVEKIDTIAMSSESYDSLLDRKDSIVAENKIKVSVPEGQVNTGDTDPAAVIAFAQTLINTPYVYGSTDPKVGFDCSGFITYVFNHFNIKVPRSSSGFAEVGQTVAVENAKPGDLILFTDPDFDNTSTTDIGHMGLITANNQNSLEFIHSTSGKAMSVVITPLTDHYKKRFVRVARIFPQNNS